MGSLCSTLNQGDCGGAGFGGAFLYHQATLLVCVQQSRKIPFGCTAEVLSFTKHELLVIAGRGIFVGRLNSRVAFAISLSAVEAGHPLLVCCWWPAGWLLFGLELSWQRAGWVALLENMSVQELVAWMRNQNLLKNRCGSCDALTSVAEDRHRATDGVCAYCPRCQSRRSVRNSSFFELHPKLSLLLILTCVAWWWEDLRISSCARMNGYNRKAVSNVYTSLDLLALPNSWKKSTQ